MSHLTKILSVNLDRPKVQLKKIPAKLVSKKDINFEPEISSSDKMKKLPVKINISNSQIIKKSPAKAVPKKHSPIPIKPEIITEAPSQKPEIITEDQDFIEADESYKASLFMPAAINSIESDKSETKLVELKNYNTDVVFRRAGIIPYLFDEEAKQYYFLFGVDRNYGELTDFGGMINSGEKFIDGAVRETYEESLAMLDYKGENAKFIEQGKLIYSSNHSMAIIFLPMFNGFIFENKEILIDRCTSFCRSYTTHTNVLPFNRIPPKIENSHIVFISENDLIELLKQRSDIPIPSKLQTAIGLTGFYPRFYEEVRRRLEPHFKNGCPFQK